MKTKDRQDMIDNICEISSVCEKCGFSRPSKRPSVFSIIVAVLSVIPTIAAIVYPYIKSSKTIDDFVYPHLILSFIAILLLFIVWYWDFKKGRSVITIKDTCNILSEFIASEFNKALDLSDEEKMIIKKAKLSGLVNIFFKDEWPAERKKAILQAKKSIFAIGYNLTNTFESEGGYLFGQLKSKVEVEDVKINIVVASETSNHDEQFQNKLKVITTAINRFRERLSDEAKKNVIFKQIEASNIDYMIVIDDTDYYIRFNLMFHAFEAYKTAILYFKLEEDETVSIDQFIQPFKLYMNKINEDNQLK